MVDLSYAYANARVKAMKTNLLPPHVLREMLVVKTLNEVIEVLEEGPYKEAFVDSSVKYSGRKLILHALFLDFSRTVQKLMKIVPPNALPALRKVLEKWEVQTIQLILASKATGEPVNADELIFLEPDRMKALKAFLNAPSLDAAITELAKTHYAPAVSGAKQEYEKAKDYRVCVNALDKFYYSELSKALLDAKDEHAEKLVRAEIDAHNFLLALRMKHSVSGKVKVGEVATPEKIEAYFIRGGDTAFAKELACVPDYDAALKLVEQKYGIADAVQAARETNSLTPIEIALDRKFVEQASHTALLSVLCFGAIIGYLYLKQKEILVVRAITFATELGLAEDMKKMVFQTGGLAGV